MLFAVASSVAVSPRQLTLDFDFSPVSRPSLVQIHTICDIVSSITWDVLFLGLVPDHTSPHRTAADAANRVAIAPIEHRRARVSLFYVDRRKKAQRVARSVRSPDK